MSESERRGRRGPHPEDRDWARRPELQRQLRKRLGFEPRTGHLRVDELERANRMLENSDAENPLTEDTE